MYIEVINGLGPNSVIPSVALPLQDVIRHAEPSKPAQARSSLQTLMCFIVVFFKRLYILLSVPVFREFYGQRYKLFSVPCVNGKKKIAIFAPELNRID